MSEENESAVDEQISRWAEDYNRLFESDVDDVTLSDEDQIPPEEMRRYVENYKKWFDPEVAIEERSQNLAKLKKVQEGWRLNSNLIDNMAKLVENQLA